jgi:hypothetical protein
MPAQDSSLPSKELNIRDIGVSSRGSIQNRVYGSEYLKPDVSLPLQYADVAGSSSAVANGLGQLDQRSIPQATGCPQAVKDLPIESAAEPSWTSLYRINAAGKEVRAHLCNMRSFYSYCTFSCGISFKPVR